MEVKYEPIFAGRLRTPIYLWTVMFRSDMLNHSNAILLFLLSPLFSSCLCSGYFEFGDFSTEEPTIQSFMDKNTYEIGEPILIKFVITNITSEIIETEIPDPYSGDIKIEMLKDGIAQRLYRPNADYIPPRLEPMERFVTISVLNHVIGESIGLDYRYLPPGNYILRIACPYYYNERLCNRTRKLTYYINSATSFKVLDSDRGRDFIAYLRKLERDGRDSNMIKELIDGSKAYTSTPFNNIIRYHELIRNKLVYQGLMIYEKDTYQKFMDDNHDNLWAQYVLHMAFREKYGHGYLPYHLQELKFFNNIIAKYPDSDLSNYADHIIKIFLRHNRN